MKCLVKGCEKDAVRQMLCEDHYDPEKKIAPSQPPAAKKSKESMPFGKRMSLAVHTMLIVSGKVAGNLVNAYNNVFELTKRERAEIFHALGSEDLKKGRQADSLAAFENAVELDPDNPEVHRKIGEAYLAADDFEKARQSLRKALELKPDYAEVYELLGAAYYNRDSFGPALTYLEKASQLSQDNDEVAYLLGMTHDKLKQFDKAIEFVQRAIDLNPRQVKYYYSLGFLFDSIGEKDKALENFKKSVELEKSSPSHG